MSTCIAPGIMLRSTGFRDQPIRPLRAAFAGFVGGYVMALAGYWLEAVLGISQLNFAHAGLRYVSGGRQGWWIVGIVFHLIDSALLGMLYAAVAYPRLRTALRPLASLQRAIASGVVFAAGVWLFIDMLIAMPFLGAGIFARRTESIRPAMASAFLHVIFGVLLGAV